MSRGAPRPSEVAGLSAGRDPLVECIPDEQDAYCVYPDIHKGCAWLI